MASAISSLDRPCATSATTSRSRLVRLSIPAAAIASGGRATNSLIRRRVTAGDSRASPRVMTRSACGGFGWLGVFQQEPARPGPQGAEDVLVEPVVGEDHHAHSVEPLVRDDLPGGLEAVKHRHLNVHQGDVRTVLGGQSLTACRPSAASATTSMSSSASSSDRMPLRISAWSSASRILITTVPERGARRTPGSRRRPGVRRAAGRRARSPVPACRSGPARDPPAGGQCWCWRRSH